MGWRSGQMSHVWTKCKHNSQNCTVLGVYWTTSLDSINIIGHGQDVGDRRGHHRQAVGVAARAAALIPLAPTSSATSAALTHICGGLATPQIHQGLPEFEVLEKWKQNETLLMFLLSNLWDGFPLSYIHRIYFFFLVGQ